MSEPSERPSPGDERIIRAGEIALGLEGRSESDRALANDSALARDIERWEDDLGALAAGIAPVPPPPRVWAAIAQAMTARPPQAARPGWAGSVALWRAVAAGSLAAAILLGFLFAQTLRGTEQATASRPGPLLVAALAPREGPPLFVIAYDPARQAVLVVPASVSPEAGTIVELWISPKDAEESIALGRLDPARPTLIPLSAAQARAIDADATLAVTSEKDGSEVSPASPGPLIAHGRFASF